MQYVGLQMPSLRRKWWYVCNLYSNNDCIIKKTTPHGQNLTDLSTLGEQIDGKVSGKPRPLYRFLNLRVINRFYFGKEVVINFMSLYWNKLFKYEWAPSWENLFLPYANNKGADQPAHPRSLISAFVFRCLDSKLPLVSTSEISRL